MMREVDPATGSFDSIIKDVLLKEWVKDLQSRRPLPEPLTPDELSEIQRQSDLAKRMGR